MATAATLAEADAALRRPYTINTFQQRLQDFEQLIKEITLQGVEGTPEERRQRIAGESVTLNDIFFLSFSLLLCMLTLYINIVICSLFSASH